MNEDLQREIYEAAAEIVTLRHNKSTEFECAEAGHIFCAFTKNGPCSGRLFAEEYETLLLEYQKGLVCEEDE